MNDIVNLLMNNLSGSGVKSIAGKLGVDEGTASNAIAVALPVLLAGLSKNASSPAGAASLSKAIDKDHDGSLLGNLAGQLGGSQGDMGAKIVGHIFGARRPVAESGVARTTGLDTAQVASLMMTLAPMVMAALGSMKKKQQLDASGLAGLLQNQQVQTVKKSEELGGLAALLDQNDDGEITDDIMRAGSGLLGGLFDRK